MTVTSQVSGFPASRGPENDHPAVSRRPGHRAARRVCAVVGSGVSQLRCDWLRHRLLCFDAVGWAAGRASGL